MLKIHTPHLKTTEFKKQFYTQEKRKICKVTCSKVKLAMTHAKNNSLS